MRQRKTYIKPEIIVFDLNVEPLDATCCTTSNRPSLVGRNPPVEQCFSCCAIVEPS